MYKSLHKCLFACFYFLSFFIFFSLFGGNFLVDVSSIAEAMSINVLLT